MKRKLLITTLFLFVIYTNLSAQKFAGGDGTKENPFQISTPEQLSNVNDYCGEEHSDIYFRLINDIDLDVPPYNEGEGWIPIGTFTGSFRGHFYGYIEGMCGSGIIKNMKIKRDAHYQGLFRAIGNGAVIANLGIENFDITANNSMDIGGLAGWVVYSNKTITIENCYAIGKTEGYNIRDVGGLIGGVTNWGSSDSIPVIIKNCYTIFDFKVGPDTAEGIGIIKNLGNIAGIVGASWGAKIINCYSNANINILDTNNSDNLFGAGIIASMVGASRTDSANIINTVVVGGSIVGDLDTLLGRLSPPGTAAFIYNDENTIANNWALKDITINGNIVTNGKSYNSHGADTTLAELQEQSFYEEVLGWDFDNIWTIKNAGEFPTFQWQHKREPVVFENDIMEFDFGDVYIGETEEQTAEIKNIGGQTATLPVPPFNNPDFVFVSDSNKISPNAKLYYTIKFTPTQLGEFNDTIIIFAIPCDIEYTIIVKGNSIEKPEPFATYTVSVSNHKNIDPTSRNYRIPIYIKADENIAGTKIEKLVVEVDRNLYFPRRVEPNTVNMNLNFIDSIIEMTFENITVPALLANEPKILLTIRGVIILGNKDSSEIIVKEPIIFSTVNNEQLFYDVKTENGFISLAICEDGRNRFLTVFDYAPSITVKKNPVTEMLEVHCKTIERGNYSLEIVDLLGNATTVETWTVNLGGTRIFDFEIDVSNFANGTYFIIMNTPTNKYSARFVIQK